MLNIIHRKKGDTNNYNKGKVLYMYYTNSNVSVNQEIVYHLKFRFGKKITSTNSFFILEVNKYLK